MRYALLPFFLFFSVCAFGQSTDLLIRSLYKQERFDTLVRLAGRNIEEVSESGLLLAGTAALHLDEKEKAALFYEACTRRFPEYGMGWYTLALFLQQESNLVQSRAAVEKALALEPLNPDFWIQKGALFDAQGLPDSALLAYQAVLFFPNYPPELHVMLGDAFFSLGKYTQALEAYKEGLQALQPSTEAHFRCRFNTASALYMLADFEQAEVYLQSILREAPEYYPALEKMVQVCYARQKFREAETYKSALYAAARDRKLAAERMDECCIDQFSWRENRIHVCERYTDHAHKYAFYVVGPEGRVAAVVQTEAREKTGDMILVMDKSEKRTQYSSRHFGPRPNYAELKLAVLDILEGRMRK